MTSGQLHRCHFIWHYHKKFSHPGNRTPLKQPFSNTTHFPAVYKFCILNTSKFLKTSTRNYRHHAGTAHCVLASHQLYRQTKEMESLWCDRFQNQLCQNVSTVTQCRSQHGKCSISDRHASYTSSIINYHSQKRAN